MLDVEIVTAATDVATDIVSLADMKKHIRLSTSNTRLDDVVTSAIEDAVAKLQRDLNRTLMPVTWRRYMDRFPVNNRDGSPRPILLPFPPLISVDKITIEDGSSPSNDLATSTYKVKTGMIVGEIWPVTTWPSLESGPRAISVTFQAGYQDYPNDLKRAIKFLAAHYIDNAEATVIDGRLSQVSKKVEFGLDSLIAGLRVPVSYDDWNE